MSKAVSLQDRRPWLIAFLPAVFLFVFFGLPNAMLLSISFLKTEAQQLTGELTLDNYVFLFTEQTYLEALLRTFFVGVSVGILDVVLAFPLAYFLVRTNSRWRGLLIALALAPLLASVVVRTYGWYVILNRFGVANDVMLWLGVIEQRLTLMPSTGAIIIGLAHSLLPYAVLTLMGALGGINPSLEKAAMSLGASRFRCFVEVVLPLALPGLIGGFILSFSVAISAYATPAILGGPATQVMATAIYGFMTQLLDWSIGAAMAVVLIVSSLLLFYLAARAGARTASL
ncbi:ABC transporter permease [Agaricicola taiwanensis]|uniref:ABC transporter permease n=1 Tax=Agaricicola taiwanensis TaxID=591372 RepID=A0A8J2VM53_9RHOB|nr:ABC transporter permease [Agaricicola taiwanensis]GGE31861.1 ABC transporter permease [Agaricicola taiwanensis]